MTSVVEPPIADATADRADSGYAKISEVATALSRHERTIRKYIRILHEDLSHPDFPERIKGSSLSPRQQAVIAQLSTYKAEGVPQPQICTFLLADCSERITLHEACEWLKPRISQELLTQFQEHFSQ
jgi:hypothetical protein